MKAALTEIGSGSIVATGALPFEHKMADGGTALLEEIGQEVPAHAVTYRVMQYVEVNFTRPGVHYTQGSDIESRLGDTITATRQWTAWSQAEINTYEAGLRDALTAQRFDNTEDILRASVLVIMDELNIHSTKLAAVLQAAADASSLTTFKTAMAAIQPIAQRSAAQIRTAIRSKIGVAS